MKADKVRFTRISRNRKTIQKNRLFRRIRPQKLFTSY